MHSFFVVPTFSGTGLSSVCFGLVHALDQLGIRVMHYKPITQKSVRVDFCANLPETVDFRHSAMDLREAQDLIVQGQTDHITEVILDHWQALKSQADVVVVEGLIPQPNEEFIDLLNKQIADLLASDIILVTAQKDYSFDEWNQRITVCASLFGGILHPRILGCIVNKVSAPEAHLQRIGESDAPKPEIDLAALKIHYIEQLPALQNPHFPCLGFIPWDNNLLSPRFDDVCQHLQGTYLNQGQSAQRRVNQITFVARTVSNLIPFLKPGSLLITPGDRDDVLVAIALAELNGVPIAGVILTGDLRPSQDIWQLLNKALNSGLPVATIPFDTIATARHLNNLNTNIPADDQERLTSVMTTFAQNINAEELAQQSKLPQEIRLSPPAFKFQLIRRAQQHIAKIVLPEGSEPRTLQAAIACAQRNIAECILLGDPEEIALVAQTLNLELPTNLTVIQPGSVRRDYVDAMVSLRAHKGLTADLALSQLEDNVVLGTMMLALDHVDGLVSGAVHTTANTIRPALQLIKTKPDCALVSSVFFMLLPEQTLVYGDCAVNPNPTAEELADIAIQAGMTAEAFGVQPNIAMISYSTGASGQGADVEKVREATRIAQAKCPELSIDGPLQYDAAAIESVAQSKAPGSKVAGHANVFIFPDLNTGNTTYKAVQRSANVLSVGPVLQGLRKPVNDLSRGATVDDIIYTIAITAIQAARPI